MSVVLKPEDLRALAADVLVANNTSEENAKSVAEALVAAELDGLPSHGVSRLPAYAAQAKCGKVDGHAVPAVREVARAAVQVDARTGFAFPAIRRGLDRAAQLVEDTGVVVVGVANSHHFGVAGYHIERLAEQGLVAIAFGNSPAAMAPWGGHKGIFGTNPIAFACPRRGRAPLLIDLSLSKVARGKVMLAHKTGKPIPEGWALDPEGKPTTDPAAALKGTMVPLGDAKGAALALMVEILSAGVTGSNYGFEASSFFDAEGPAPRVGQFFVVLNPYAFNTHFLARIEHLLSAIVSQPGTRLPGDRRLAAREKAAKEGVTIPAQLHAELLALGGQRSASA